MLGLHFDDVGGTVAADGFEHMVGPPFQFLEGHRASLVGTGQFDPAGQEAERFRAGRQQSVNLLVSFHGLMMPDFHCRYRLAQGEDAPSAASFGRLLRDPKLSHQGIAFF